MEPSTLSAISTGISAVGTGISAYSQYKKGKVEETAYEYNADIALQKTRAERSVSRRKAAQLSSEQRLLYAKAGVDITSGSPLLIMADTLMQADIEQEELWKAGTQEAGLQKYYGRTAARTATTGAMSTFLTGLGKAGLQWTQRKG